MRIHTLIVASSAVCSLIAAAVAQYTVEVLPSHGSSESLMVTGMNDAGWITGYYPDGQNFRSVVWNTEEWIPAVGLSEKNTFINGINNAGTAIGQSDMPTMFFHGVSFTDGELTDLTSENRIGSAYGINDSGTICGFAYFAGSGTRAFITTAEGLQPLGTLGGYMSLGMAINNNNVVVGRSYTANRITEAFITHENAMASIAPQGALWSSAEAVNDIGMAVGTYRTAEGHRGFYYDGCESFDIGMPPGVQELWMTDINTAGIGVGYGYIDQSTYVSVKYEAGNLVDLSTLIDPESEIQPGVAFAVNNLGWIAVLATFDGETGVTAILKPTIPQ